MNVTHLMTTMTASISEVMEIMFYTPIEPREAESIKACGFPEDDDIEACAITFSGSFSGQFFIFIPRSLLGIMTENFIGEPRENLTKEHLDGTLKETLNMIAGNTFSKIDPDASFGLGVPEIDPALHERLCNEEAAVDKTKRGFFLINTMDGDMAVGFNLN